MSRKIIIIFVTVFSLAAPLCGGQITNSVNVTTNLSFYLTAPASDEKKSQFKSDQAIQYLLTGTSTNLIYFRLFQSGSFDFHLFDANGTEVPKSNSGLAFTGNARKPTLKELKKYDGFFVDNEMAVRDNLFRPDEMFLITKKGIYELEVKVRLCVIMTNGLPDSNAMLDGRNAMPSGYPAANDFGILYFPPLRVNIIKD